MRQGAKSVLTPERRAICWAGCRPTAKEEMSSHEHLVTVISMGIRCGPNAGCGSGCFSLSSEQESLRVNAVSEAPKAEETGETLRFCKVSRARIYAS